MFDSLGWIAAEQLVWVVVLKAALRYCCFITGASATTRSDKVRLASPRLRVIAFLMLAICCGC